MSNKYLLNVSVGPVQEFIAEARKVRDLWVGSYLLSMLTYKALKPFMDNSDYDIIYPAYKTSPVYKRLNSQPVSDPDLLIASFPNHFLVSVPGTSLVTLIKSSHDECQQYWEEISESTKKLIQKDLDSIFNAIKGSSTPDKWDSLWENQIKDHWIYMWVALPVNEEDLKTNYQDCIKKIQRLLEERKMTRTFAQWHGSPAIKCTQYARRESMGPDDLAKNKIFWERSQDRFDATIRKGDRLCAVCLIKRFIKPEHFKINGLKDIRFQSTMDVAVKPYKELVNNLDDNIKKDFLDRVNNIRKIITPYKKEVANIDEIEGDFFYRDEMDEKRHLKEYAVKAADKSKLKEYLNVF